MKTYIVVFDAEISTLKQVAAVFNKTFDSLDALKKSLSTKPVDIMQLGVFCQDLNSGNDCFSCSYVAPVFILN